MFDPPALLRGSKRTSAVDGTDSVRPFLLSFEGDSPTPEPKFISAFTHCHRFGKIGIQSSANFLQPDLLGFQFLFRTKGERLQTLQNANQIDPHSGSREKSLHTHLSYLLIPIPQQCGWTSCPVVHRARLKNIRTIDWTHEWHSGQEFDRKGQRSTLYSAKEGIPRPAQVGKKPGNWDAREVASEMGNR
jgi:hypothetical protein